MLVGFGGGGCRKEYFSFVLRAEDSFTCVFKSKLGVAGKNLSGEVVVVVVGFLFGACVWLYFFFF